MPTTGQIHILSLAIVLMIAGLVLSLARLWSESEGVRLGAKACYWSGLIVTIAALIWHSVTRASGSWWPLEDNFDALAWLGALLALFVLYVQRWRRLGGLDWFVMPVVIVLLVAAGVFGKAKPQAYLDTAWSWAHRVTAYGGAVAFVIAGASGAMYLLANRRLRNKTPAHGPNLGSLERLEQITFNAVTVGFALLTIGLITGLMHRKELGAHWFANPKVILGFAVWMVYAVVLHARINPAMRGRKVAVLSILGCVLMVGTLLVLNVIPQGGTR